MVFLIKACHTFWIGLRSHPCWTLYRNSLRTERLKLLGKLWDTLSLMKASMTACQRAEVLQKERMIYRAIY